MTPRRAARVPHCIRVVGAVATFGLKGAADADLPTTKGPQTSGENGKGGSVKARL